jgi:hypothetical protein
VSVSSKLSDFFIRKNEFGHQPVFGIKIGQPKMMSLKISSLGTKLKSTIKTTQTHKQKKKDRNLSQKLERMKFDITWWNFKWVHLRCTVAAYKSFMKKKLLINQEIQLTKIMFKVMNFSYIDFQQSEFEVKTFLLFTLTLTVNYDYEPYLIS